MTMRTGAWAPTLFALSFHAQRMTHHDGQAAACNIAEPSEACLHSVADVAAGESVDLAAGKIDPVLLS